MTKATMRTNHVTITYDFETDTQSITFLNALSDLLKSITVVDITYLTVRTGPDTPHTSQRDRIQAAIDAWRNDPVCFDLEHKEFLWNRLVTAIDTALTSTEAP